MKKVLRIFDNETNSQVANKDFVNENSALEWLEKNAEPGEYYLVWVFVKPEVETGESEAV